ncbi:F0F1 ATP synthase subunit delta [Leifsonia aquatica]
MYGDAAGLLLAAVILVAAYRLASVGLDRLFSQDAREWETLRLGKRLNDAQHDIAALQEAIAGEITQRTIERQRFHRAATKLAEMAASPPVTGVPPNLAVGSTEAPVSQAQQHAADNHDVDLVRCATAHRTADAIMDHLREREFRVEFGEGLAVLDELGDRAVQRKATRFPEVLIIADHLGSEEAEAFAHSLDTLVSRLRPYPVSRAIFDRSITPDERRDALHRSGVLADLDAQMMNAAQTLVSRYQLRELTGLLSTLREVLDLRREGVRVKVIAANPSIAHYAAGTTTRHILEIEIDEKLIAGFVLQSAAGDFDRSLRSKLVNFLNDPTMKARI